MSLATIQREILLPGLPSKRLPSFINDWREENQKALEFQSFRLAKARKIQVPHIQSSLYLRLIKADGEEFDLGLASLRVVTTAGVNAIVAAFTSAGNLGLFKFHALGTGTNAEAVGDTALQTELTTQYNPDSTRATGTTVVGATNNIFRTVATNTVDVSANVTEHGIFTQAATGGGTLLDRSVFSSVSLGSGDGISSTYELLFSAGG